MQGFGIDGLQDVMDEKKEEASKEDSHEDSQQDIAANEETVHNLEREMPTMKHRHFGTGSAEGPTLSLGQPVCHPGSLKTLFSIYT